MARKGRANAYVLDTWAIMAYLGDEQAGAEVEGLITEALEEDIPLYMSAVNAAEVWYTMARRFSEAIADQSLSEINQFRVQFQDIDMGLALNAARFKARHKMSLADCFAAALAVQVDGELVTGDSEFRSVVKEVKLLWLSTE
ncbi:MAG: type II toxin-antitoxin system VapC family toxin [Anaerolineales bacterium]